MWKVGESRYVTLVTDSSVIAVSAYMFVYDTETEEIVASGEASVDNTTIYALWSPSTTGIYVAEFRYFVGEEQYTDSVFLEVKETL